MLYESSPPDSSTRRRKAAKRLALSLGMMSVTLIVFALAGRSFYAYCGHRDLQSYIAELDSVGPAWRLEDIEAARERIPDEENSAPIVVAAHALLPSDWSKEPQLLEPRVPGISESLSLEERLRDIPPHVQLDEELTAKLRAELRKVPDAVDKARQLIDMPKGRHAIAYAPDFISTLLTDQQKSRDVAKLLSWDATLRAQEGDADQSIASCRGIVNAGRSVGDEPLLISILIRLACVRIAQQRLERSLAQGQAPDAALRAMQKLLDDESTQPLFRNAVRGERAGLHTLMGCLETGGTNLSGLSTGGGAGSSSQSSEVWALFMLGPGFYQRNHLWTLKLMTEVVEIVDSPDEEQKDKLAEWVEKVKGMRTTHPIEALLPALLIPAVDKVSEACLRHRATLRCSVTALAAERYRLRHGRWPDSIDALVTAELLAEMPIDPYDNQPLRFRRTGDGVLIYSLGPDRTDDGGIMDRKNITAPGTDLGFQLWDADHRRRRQ